LICHETSLTHSAELTTITFHPDGHLLAAGAADGSIKLYDVKTSQLAHTFPAASPSPIAAVSFSENGTWLASAHQNETSAIVWDLRKLNQLATLEVGTAITGLTWDYTGQFLAACGPSGVVVSQYEKKSKAWSEPLRRAVKAVDVQWGSQAKSLVALTSEGAVNVLA
jgi:pre-mRNA-processing factor 19